MARPREVPTLTALAARAAVRLLSADDAQLHRFALVPQHLRAMVFSAAMTVASPRAICLLRALWHDGCYTDVADLLRQMPPGNDEELVLAEICMPALHQLSLALCYKHRTCGDECPHHHREVANYAYGPMYCIGGRLWRQPPPTRSVRIRRRLGVWDPPGGPMVMLEAVTTADGCMMLRSSILAGTLTWPTCAELPRRDAPYGPGQPASAWYYVQLSLRPASVDAVYCAWSNGCYVVTDDMQRYVLDATCRTLLLTVQLVGAGSRMPVDMVSTAARSQDPLGRLQHLCGKLYWVMRLIDAGGAVPHLYLATDGHGTTKSVHGVVFEDDDAILAWQQRRADAASI
jgi:hypothetical protein